MAREDSYQRISNIELSILKALCLRQVVASESAVLTLTTYRWRDHEHQVVYAALRKLPVSSEPGVLRERLPALATRMGFPDLPWHIYFAPAVEPANIEELLSQLNLELAKQHK
jgi:hypothetical protein